MWGLFKSIVSVDFDIDVNNPKSLYNYLSFKTQCLQVLNIRYTGNQDEFLRYEGYSKLLKKDVDIIVDKQFPDNVRIN